MIHSKLLFFFLAISNSWFYKVQERSVIVFKKMEISLLYLNLSIIWCIEPVHSRQIVKFCCMDIIVILLQVKAQLEPSLWTVQKV